MITTAGTQSGGPSGTDMQRIVSNVAHSAGVALAVTGSLSSPGGGVTAHAAATTPPMTKLTVASTATATSISTIGFTA